MRINPYNTSADRLKRAMGILYRAIPLIFLISACAYAGTRVVSGEISLKNFQKEKTERVAKHVPKVVVPTAEQIYDSLYAEAKAHKIDSILKYAHKRLGFHGSVSVSKKGKLVYEGAIGTADFSTGKELSKDDVFQLASVSKQFTAMAIMILQEKGKLNYDDTINQYLPTLPYKGITIRHLLNHTAGLPNYMWLIEHKWKEERNPYNSDVLTMMAEHELPRYFYPGRKFDYSNTGYMLLASIVEEVSGQRFDQFVTEQIFKPLGMNDSYVYCTGLPDMEQRNHVLGYEKRWRKYRIMGEDPNNGTVGDKNVYSTVHDMYLWEKALTSEVLVCSNNLNEAFSPGRTRWRKSIPYGFGFRLKNNKKENLVYHNGLWNGFRTAFVRDIDNEVTYVLLNHTNSRAKANVLRKIQRVMEEPEDIKVEVPTKVVAQK